MTQVDFYIMGEQAQGDRYRLACRLTEKAWQQGHRIYLHTNSAAESRHLDQLLWTFRQGSFLPHGLSSDADPELTPILIGDSDHGSNEHDVLINLASDVPEFFSRFSRVAELVDRDAKIKQESRQRFRFYRDRGYPLNTHEIKK
jgi:DNA polymerase-3 subunit chi